MSVPGTVIADRYRLVRQVGTGGMGVVWEAMDERLGRPVAVKQLRAQVGLSEVEAELAKNRAMREARITARLHHRYAVPVFDVVEHEGGPCLIMQFLPSMPLSAVLREGGPLTPDEAARVGAQVASALAAAHQLKIVHRDVKPGNILVADDGTALISDFGISHALGDATLTSTGMVHGTPAYLAPEVARGSESSFASDVYSLGGTLYAALEGAPPFGTDQNSIALLHRVATGEYVPPQRCGGLTPLVTAMLSADPAERPSMQEVASRLAALAAPRPAPPAPNLDAATLPLVPPVAAAAAVPPPPPASAPVTMAESAQASATDPVREPADPVVATPIPAAPAVRGNGEPPRRRGRVVALVLTLALLAAAALGGAALLDGRLGAVPTTTDPPSSSSEASEPQQPTSSEGPSEPASSSATTSSAPSSASPTPKPTPKPKPKPTKDDDDEDDDSPPRAAELAQAVTGYYALMPGDTDAAWPRLTSGYQSGHAGGRQAFENFWGAVRRVSVSDVSGTPPDQAQATVTYFYRDGRVVREQTAYRLVEDDGRLKIAASTVLSSTG